MTPYHRFRPSAIAIALGLAAAASAQTTTSTTVTFALTWQESDANGIPVANPDGILEPGESDLLRLTVSFTNQNTIGSFAPSVGTFSSGTIRGFGAGFIELDGTNNAAGAWNVNQAVGLGTTPAWDLIGPYGWGTPADGGAILRNIQMGQFPMTPQAIITTNPIPDIWRGVWTPASFASRTVTFVIVQPSTGGGSLASVLFATSASTLASAFVSPGNDILGSAHIPIAPAPAGFLTLAPFLYPRRRRAPSPTGATT